MNLSLTLEKSLSQSRKTELLKKILVGATKIKNEQDLTIQKFRVDFMGSKKIFNQIKSVTNSTILNTLPTKKPKQKTHILSTTMRKEYKDQFNWNSILGGNLSKVTTTIDDHDQLFYHQQLSAENKIKKTDSRAHLVDLNISYTCPELGGRVLLAGEANRMVFFNDTATRIVGLMDCEERILYNFAYVSNHEVLVSNDRKVTIHGGHLLQPKAFKLPFCKFYYKNRPNMNRNLHTDLTTLYYLSKLEGECNFIVALDRSVFNNMNTVRTAEPKRIVFSKHSEDFCITEKFIYGVSPNGGVCKIKKKDHDQTEWTPKFQELHKSNKAVKWDQFEEYYTSIAANELAVVTASDSLQKKRTAFDLYDARSMKLLDQLHVENTVGNQINPVHSLKLLLFQDLCIAAALMKMYSLRLVALIKYKLIFISEVSMVKSQSALWGFHFLPKTNEFLVHGCAKVFLKFKLNIPGSRTTETVEVDEDYEKFIAVKENRNSKEAESAWIRDDAPKMKCEMYETFTAAIDDFDKKEFEKAKQSKKMKTSNR